MMYTLREEWLLLFAETKSTIPIDTSLFTLFCDEKIVMDNILLFYNHIPIRIDYFSCIAQVFTKFRLSFKLSKCEFFKHSAEFVSHDHTTVKNFPVEFKFQLIEKCPLPKTGIFLFLISASVPSITATVHGLKPILKHCV